MAGLHGCLVAQGFMGPCEVVFDEPFGQFPVEDFRIGMEVTQSDELFPEGTVEALVVGVVRGSPDAGIVLFDTQSPAGVFEVLLEFRPVVVSDSRYVFVEEEVQSEKEVLPVPGTLVLVHPGIGHFAVLVDSGKDVALEMIPVDGDGIEADDVAGLLLVVWKRAEFQFRDLLFLAGFPSFGFQSSCFDGVVVQVVSLDHFLDLPRRNGFMVGIAIDDSQLHLPPADMLFAQPDDTLCFKRGNCSVSHVDRSPRSVFQLVQAVEIVPIKRSKPFVERFP